MRQAEDLSSDTPVSGGAYALPCALGWPVESSFTNCGLKPPQEAQAFCTEQNSEMPRLALARSSSSPELGSRESWLISIARPLWPSGGAVPPTSQSLRQAQGQLPSKSVRALRGRGGVRVGGYGKDHSGEGLGRTRDTGLWQNPRLGTSSGVQLGSPRLAAVTPSFSLAQERLLLIQILPNAEQEGLTLPHPRCLAPSGPRQCENEK